MFYGMATRYMMRENNRFSCCHPDKNVVKEALMKFMEGCGTAGGNMYIYQVNKTTITESFPPLSGPDNVWHENTYPLHALPINGAVT